MTDQPESALPRRLRAGALCLSCFALAVGIGAYDRQAGAAGGSDAPEPSVEFISPRPGETVTSPVRVEVRLSNFELRREHRRCLEVPGQGHIHFALDGGVYDTPETSSESEAIVKHGSGGRHTPAYKTSVTYVDVSPGKHWVAAELLGNANTPTGVGKTISFKVR